MGGSRLVSEAERWAYSRGLSGSSSLKPREECSVGVNGAVISTRTLESFQTLGVLFGSCVIVNR